jgi:phosphatidate cytidylyltransferase
MKNETWIRALSGSVYVALLVVSAHFPLINNLLFCVLCMVCAAEFARMSKQPLPRLWAVIVGFSFLLIDNFLPQKYFTGLVISSMVITLFLGVNVFRISKSSNWTMGQGVLLVWGYMLVPALCLVHLPQQNGAFFPERLISLFVLIWTNDTFAYLTGKKWGKHKLLERISPKKTWEGFVGGIVVAIGAGLILSNYYLHEPWYIGVLFATMAGAMGTLGDLVESKLKRQCGVKDSGSFMPGHGGALDRLDSLLFVTPWIYLLLQH